MMQRKQQILKKIWRHQYYVQLAKVILPAFTLFLVVLLFWLPQLTSSIDYGERAALLNAQHDIIDSEAALLNAPVLVGNAGGWAYDIRAKAASNVDVVSERIDLIAPSGVMVKGNEVINGKADSGSWFSGAEVLELLGNAKAEHSTGYMVESGRIQIHADSQNIHALSRTKGRADFGTFEADQAILEDEGQTIRLLGNSHIILTGQKPQKEGQ